MEAQTSSSKAKWAKAIGVPWQRCQFHLQQNAQFYVPEVSLRTEVAEDIRKIFDAQDRDTDETDLRASVEKKCQDYARSGRLDGG